MAIERIRLEKKDQEWTAEFDGPSCTLKWGKAGGKTQVKSKTWLSGTNEGKSNATTPEQQCRRDIVAKAMKKIADNYVVVEGQGIIDAYGTGLQDETHFDVPQPMLAKVYADHSGKVRAEKVLALQAKKDGNRCLVNLTTGKLYSRKRKEIACFPGLGDEVVKACSWLSDDGVEWADGELFAPGMSFNEIQSLIRSDEPAEGNERICFHMYDYVSDEEQLMRAKRLNDNRVEMSNGRVDVLETFFLYTTGVPSDKLETALMVWHDRFVEAGDEGLIVRLPGKGYQQKRTDRLLKLKVFMDDEFEIVGWEHEKNEPTKMGTAVLKMASGATFRARPKMSEKEKAATWAERDGLVGKMATIRFQNFDEKSGIPRFPVFIGIGVDKQKDED